MKKIALVRGKFLNAYEMQSFFPLVRSYDITAFGSATSYHDEFNFPVVKLVSPMDVPEFPYKMQLLNRIFVDAQYLLGLTNRLRGFDLVHSAETYFHYTQQSLRAKRLGYVRKVIATVLENIPHNNEGIWGRKHFKMRARHELDHMIALTQLTKKALIEEGAKESKITVIGHGINTVRFRPSADHWKRLRQDRRLLTILFCGRLEVYKGVYEILDAASILLADKTIRNSIQFIFTGNGSERKNMMRIERRRGIDSLIRHTSYSYTDMPGIYAKADIVVVPSKRTKTWMEQYCTVLLEAQSMGMPIVTTRSGGISENVGDSALFVQEGNSQELAYSIKKFITDPDFRVTYGKKAHQRAEKVHDIKHISKKISDVYELVLHT